LRTTPLSVVPAGFVSWFPASVLLGRRPAWEWTLTPLAALVAVAIACIVFRKDSTTMAEPARLATPTSDTVVELAGVTKTYRQRQRQRGHTIASAFAGLLRPQV